ncbi:MAG TPA: AAA family ATPase, partial [Geobacteraceae bacterium]
MQQQISLIIIDSQQESRDFIEKAIRPYENAIKIHASTPDFPSGLRAVETFKPNVVILEVTDLHQGVIDVSQILEAAPRASVFVTAATKEPDWILRLIRAGAMEYLPRPIEPVDLLEGLRKVGKFWADTANVSENNGIIISVYNPIGGMGTTTIAVNLAAALAAKHDNVAIVDFNLFSGDVATFLDVNPKYTLSSVTTNVSRLDASFLMTVMTRHSCGLYVLSEPLDVEETIGITAEQFHKVLDFLKKAFSYVIIDTGGPLFGGNLITFQDSDHILFNTVLSLPALKNAKRYLAAMEKQGVRKDQLKLIVNRHLPKSDIRIADAEKVLERKVFYTIPNDYADVMTSINTGKPIVSTSPRSAVSVAITTLSER